MLVTTENYLDVLRKIMNSDVIAIDTETTGLRPFKDDDLFAIIISTEVEDYYFNFLDYPSVGIESLSDEVMKYTAFTLSNYRGTVIGQNLKFDLHFLAKRGIYIPAKFTDLGVCERLLNNQHLSYSLDAIAKRWGDEKLDIVMNYIKEHKLKTTISVPELDKEYDILHFEAVPFEIMNKYAEKDARVTFDLHKLVTKRLLDEDTIYSKIPSMQGVVESENRLIRTLFNMEQRGVKLDMRYCREALEHYRAILSAKEAEFKSLTGIEFKKGTTVFEEVFASEKARWEKTEKGNWKWDADVLAAFENPAARVVIDWSEAKKQFEYFANFIFYADKDGVLHPDFKQAGTVTGRLSCRDPNLQNLSNPDKYDEASEASKFPVRAAFVPREGYFFASIDYQQVEFRLAVMIAKANSLIREVLKGHDVHTATANVSGTSRKEAKTTNFLTIYGGGVVKLAQGLFETRGSKHQLGAIYKNMFGWRKSEDEALAELSVDSKLTMHNEPLIQKAYDIQQSIFRAAPEIKDFLTAAGQGARNRGFVFNYLGRRFQFPDKRWTYRAPNHIIQGTAADVIKQAMNEVDRYLKDRESKMILTIHDELIIEVKKGEEYVVPAVAKLMESVYTGRVPLLVDIEYSYKNLADKHPWPPQDIKDESKA